MFNVVLVEPEIPPNTGNVIRLCANTGARLHLIEPLGFPLDDAKMRRAGLDYHEYAQMHVHANWDAFLAKEAPDASRMFAFTTRGSTPFFGHTFQAGDWFVFGAETRGLPDAVLDAVHERTARASAYAAGQQEFEFIEYGGGCDVRSVASDRVRGRRIVVAGRRSLRRRRTPYSAFASRLNNA